MFSGNLGDTVGHLAGCLLHQRHLLRETIIVLKGAKCLWQKTNICLVLKRLIMNSTCKGEIVASSPPDSEISLWSLSNCWIWSSMLLSKFCNIFSNILPSNSLLNAYPVFLPSLSLPAVWCWTWWGPCPPPSPLQSTPPYPGRQASGRKTLKWSRTY